MVLAGAVTLQTLISKLSGAECSTECSTDSADRIFWQVAAHTQRRLSLYCQAHQQQTSHDLSCGEYLLVTARHGACLLVLRLQGSAIKLLHRLSDITNRLGSPSVSTTSHARTLGHWQGCSKLLTGCSRRQRDKLHAAGSQLLL